jgi:hypothetical protein
LAQWLTKRRFKKDNYHRKGHKIVPPFCDPIFLGFLKKKKTTQQSAVKYKGKHMQLSPQKLKYASPLHPD